MHFGVHLLSEDMRREPHITLRLPLDRKTLLICNEEGKLQGMQGNRRLENGSVIAGPFLIVRDGGSDFASLTDHQTELYMNKFKKPQEISQEEVQADMGMTFIPL